MKYNLPTVITKDVWFYEENKDVLEKYLGVPYISYSSVSSFTSPTYFDGFIKSKFAGIRDDGSVYTFFGSFLGESIEHGVWQENKHGFEGMDKIDLNALRCEGAEYEKFVVIDFEGFILIGFIDKAVKDEELGWSITDFKSGATKKIDEYKSKEYVQTVLYSHALELQGEKINKHSVTFVEREGSHINPPLKFSGKKTEIPLEYNKERVEYARDKVIKAVKGISDLYTTYLKIFGT